MNEIKNKAEKNSCFMLHSIEVQRLVNIVEIHIQFHLRIKQYFAIYKNSSVGYIEMFLNPFRYETSVINKKNTNEKKMKKINQDTYQPNCDNYMHENIKQHSVQKNHSMI